MECQPWHGTHDRRDTMLAIPNRILSFDRLTAPVISNKKEDADEEQTHGSDDDKHKHKNGIE